MESSSTISRMFLNYAKSHPPQQPQTQPPQQQIVIPPYETSQMSLRMGRRLRNKQVRQMLTWSFFRFKTRLLQVARRLGRRVVICSEEYTSQTCSCCGGLTKSSSKLYKCMAENCPDVADRDVNGARNILLKTLDQL